MGDHDKSEIIAIKRVSIHVSDSASRFAFVIYVYFKQVKITKQKTSFSGMSLI